MKHLLLQKTSLLLATFLFMAGAAHAGSPMRLSAPAAQSQAEHFPNLLPDSIYQLDDGTSEGCGGIWISTYGYDICLNQFPVIPGSETISSVSINWGWPGLPQWGLDGIPYTIGIWSDPNGDGQPDDAVLLATATDVIANSGTDTFVTTQITPTTINTPDFFVGFVVYNGPPYYPCSIDESNPQSERSFYAAGIDFYDLNNLTDNVVPIESLADFGFSANYMIRADSASSSDDLVLTGGSSARNGWSVTLPKNGTGVEDRSGGAKGAYTINLSFNNSLASVGSVSTSCGTVSSFKINPKNAQQIQVGLAGVSCTATEITITATGVKDTNGHSLDSAALRFGLLIGDVNGDRVVDHKDVQIVNRDMNQEVNAGNLRAKVAADRAATIDTADADIAMRSQGMRLP